MNISYNWLKDLIDLDLSPDETAAALTRVGLAVEGIHPHKDDLVLDIDLTSNRSDCLSHLGIARELGVSTGKEITAETQRRRDQDSAETSLAAIGSAIVQIDAPELCHRFTARIIKGIKVGPSPQWLVDRLEALGERSINNIADITNYVMLELGQPMHAFDLDKLSENRIIVRRARPGETIKTLDEEDRKLDETMLAICDADKPVAVAGIMGGFDSGISDSTTNVLLEVAYFDRENIRATSRKLKLATEASYRFERGVDIEKLIAASDRATELINDLAGGDADEIFEVYPTKSEGKRITSGNISAAVERMTGLSVDSSRCDLILASLGIEKADGGVYSIPSWRHDLAIEVDLVEEIARHVGYDNIQDELPPAYGAGEYQPHETSERSIRENLANTGYFEVLNYSFIDEDWDDVFELVSFGDSDGNLPESGNVTLQDAIIDGAVRMRRSLLPGLLTSIKHNFNQQRRDLAIFEIGKVFTLVRPKELPIERKLFAMAITGHQAFESRAGRGFELDIYDLKGHLEAALESAGIQQVSFASSDIRHLRRGQSAAISVAGRIVGTLGRLSDEIAGRMKFKQPIYLCEVDLATLLELGRQEVIYSPLSRFPSMVRDVSFVVKRSFEFSDLENVVRSENEPLLVKFAFVDLYRGKGLNDDESSLTVRFEYRSDERTLDEGDVDVAHQRILDSIKSSLDVEPRF